jgi:cephalosporin hydroxylase
MSPDPRSQYHFSDYARSLRTHYKEFATDSESIRYIENVAASCEALQPRADRFQKLENRNFGSSINAWHACRGTVPTGVASGYKGLLRIKTPFDLVLYQNLVWELRPKTILEFGSLQGGSGLWLSDLMDAFDIEGGEVHSFDLFGKCISPLAKHPRLRFHSCNLYELETLDDGLLSRLPHPWLVIDDAHVNVLDVTLKVDRHVEVGDYYILEDIGLSPTIAFVEGMQKICARGYAIDSDYADAFGYNVTSAPNGWLRKMHKA